MDKAIECIKQAIDNHPTHVDEDAVNILAELYIVQKKYAEVYEVRVLIIFERCSTLFVLSDHNRSLQHGVQPALP